MWSKLLVRPLLVFITVLSASCSGTEAKPWATVRDATAEEQALVDSYRRPDALFTFMVDFRNTTLSQSLFLPQSDELDKLDSCRKGENVVVSGVLRLETHLTTKCHTLRSTGYVISDRARQSYGYFEARMQITNTRRTNNAFWLVGGNIEIDVVEAWFPDTINMSVHNWATPYRARRCTIRSVGLAERMNDYGVLWLPDRLVYTLNGKAICVIVVDIPDTTVDVRFSTAIGSFGAQEQSGEEVVDGAAMLVQWVRAAHLRRE